MHAYSYIVDKSMIDEYTELALATELRKCHTLRLVEDSIVIHRKVEVVRFNDGSDCEFPTEFLITTYCYFIVSNI